MAWAVMGHRDSKLVFYEIRLCTRARRANIIHSRKIAMHLLIVRLLFKARNMHMEWSIGGSFHRRAGPVVKSRPLCRLLPIGGIRFELLIDKALSRSTIQV